MARLEAVHSPPAYFLMKRFPQTEGFYNGENNRSTPVGILLRHVHHRHVGRKPIGNGGPRLAASAEK